MSQFISDVVVVALGFIAMAGYADTSMSKEDAPCLDEEQQQ